MMLRIKSVTVILYHLLRLFLACTILHIQEQRVKDAKNNKSNQTEACSGHMHSPSRSNASMNLRMSP